MKKLTRLIIGILTIAYTVSLIYYSKEVSAGIIRSIQVCVTSIIPSLFAFMVISEFIISSDLYKILSIPFSPIAKYIFKIPNELFSVFLLSSVAGYPVGAKLISDLCSNNKISKETAEKMLGYCYLGGPAFFCGIVGVKMYSSVKVGMIIFLCVFLSNVTLGIVSGFTMNTENNIRSDINIDFSLNNLVRSISNGGISILKICSAIVFFSSVVSVLESSGILNFLAEITVKISGLPQNDCLAIIKSILEISNISALSASAVSMPIIASLLSFGGSCVIMQTESIVSGRLSTNNFYLFRIISIFISYFYCKIVIYVLDMDKIIQTSMTIYVGYRQTSPMPSIFLLIMTILLLSNNYIVKHKKI